MVPCFKARPQYGLATHTPKWILPSSREGYGAVRRTFIIGRKQYAGITRAMVRIRWFAYFYDVRKISGILLLTKKGKNKTNGFC